MQTKPVVFYLFMTYAIIEIFRLLLNTQVKERIIRNLRYPYYLLSIYGHSLDLLTWMR